MRASGRAVLDARHWPGVERVLAGALHPETPPAALQGVDLTCCLVHSMAAGRDFGRLDPQSASHFAAAAAQAHVRRIVYLGGLILYLPVIESGIQQAVKCDST